MDQFTHTLVPFPLLVSPSYYFPDTQDLTVDTEAREYWLQCFEDALDKVSRDVTVEARLTTTTSLFWPLFCPE